MSKESLTFGKQQEFAVIAALLSRGFDVYPTLVDTKGIDCVVRLSQRTYLDVQIKARSRKAKQPTTFATMDIVPRANYFFIFYTESKQTFWVIPSKELIRLARRNKTGDNAGTYSLVLPRSPEKPGRFRDYVGLWHPEEPSGSGYGDTVSDS